MPRKKPQKRGLVPEEPVEAKLIAGPLFLAWYGVSQVMYWIAKNAVEKAQAMPEGERAAYLADWNTGLGACSFVRKHGKRLFSQLGGELTRWGVDIQNMDDLNAYLADIEKCMAWVDARDALVQEAPDGEAGSSAADGDRADETPAGAGA